jgi:cytochrome bd-type quinol oxidase subunit 2
MRRILIALLASVAFLAVPAVGIAADNPVQDVDCSGAAASSSICRGINEQSNPLFGPSGILTRVANIFALITGIIAVFMAILGGLRYILSSGDSSKTASAKNTIMYAAIGVAVAASAGLIARFLLSKFG